MSMPIDHANRTVPVITIDGPTASGKGTITNRVAKRLNWHVLDSGSLYRLTALSIDQSGLADTVTESQAAQSALELEVAFNEQEIILNGQDVAKLIRQEKIGNLASKIAAWPGVRQALLQTQRSFRKAPGLVADGRDLGTVIFPDAPLKIFLDADVEIRAQRRYKQLNEKGISAKISDLLSDLVLRDKRDKERLYAPLIPATDAVIIDSSNISIDVVVQNILNLWAQRAAS